MASASNPFIDTYLPGMFWNAELAVFGTTVTYLPGGDPAEAVPIRVLWKDGQTDEDTSPGRYSHMDVENSQFPEMPKRGDLIVSGTHQYEIVHINALAVRFSVIVVQDNGVL